MVRTGATVRPRPDGPSGSAAVVTGGGERVAADAHLRDGLGVHRHLGHHRLAGDTAHDAEVLDDQAGVHARPAELLVRGQGGALVGRPVDHEEPAEVPTVGIEQGHVHALDAPGGLHPPEHLDELAEYLDGTLLTAAHGLAEPDEQRAFCHHDSSRSLTDGTSQTAAADARPVTTHARAWSENGASPTPSPSRNAVLSSPRRCGGRPWT